jgi:hypothetical protein
MAAALRLPMKTRPRKPRLLREVNNGANGMTNFGDIRLRKRSNLQSAAAFWWLRSWAGAGRTDFPVM